MKHRFASSLDSRLLGALTVAFGLMCVCALGLEVMAAPKPPVAETTT
jgi:hypothetical protein